MKLTLFLALFVFSNLANAVLNLDTPEHLLQKASVDRQQLRDVVLSLELQLPEMRDFKTFESYFFILDQLKMDSDRLGLDDLYPDAVLSIGKKMASFGIKWVDLSVMPQERLSYYLKWLDVDALSNLLSYSSFYTKQIVDPNLLKNLSSNLDYIIVNSTALLKDRFDIQIGYRELSSTIAIKFLMNPELSNDEIKYWANKIYTSQGLGLYLTQIQDKIFALNADNKAFTHQLFLYLELSFQISDRLIDSPLSYLRDHISDLSVELIKKSFEQAEPLQADEIKEIVSQLGVRHLQSLSSLLTTMTEPTIYKNASTLVAIAGVLVQELNNKNLTTEAISLNLFLTKISAALIVDRFEAEGTYTFRDKLNQVWKLSLVKTHPFELIAALSNESWSLYQSYYSVKYSLSEDLFTASNSLSDNDGSNSLSVITFKLMPDHTLILTDVFGSTTLKEIKGTLTEPLIAQHFSPKSGIRRNDIFEGEIVFGTSSKPTHVEMTIQSDGLTATARIRDQYGLIYDFTTGSFNENNEFSLTSGHLKSTSWAHLRGTIDEKQLTGRIIIGGKGFASTPFTLKRKSL